jgi:hypothetical protein
MGARLPLPVPCPRSRQSIAGAVLEYAAPPVGRPGVPDAQSCRGATGPYRRQD